MNFQKTLTVDELTEAFKLWRFTFEIIVRSCFTSVLEALNGYLHSEGMC